MLTPRSGEPDALRAIRAPYAVTFDVFGNLRYALVQCCVSWRAAHEPGTAGAAAWARRHVARLAAGARTAGDPPSRVRPHPVGARRRRPAAARCRGLGGGPGRRARGAVGRPRS